MKEKGGHSLPTTSNFSDSPPIVSARPAPNQRKQQPPAEHLEHILGRLHQLERIEGHRTGRSDAVVAAMNSRRMRA